MSDLTAVRRRKSTLQAMKQQIDAELEQLEVAEQVLLRLEKDDSSDAVISMNLTTDLEGKSAAEAAKFVLARSNSLNEGMHYQDILSVAVRLGFRRGEEDLSADSMRRALSKRDDLFESMGEGRFRLKKG
jgi:hypothetical protein